MHPRKGKRPVKFWKDRISFVLIDPGESGNIGAARALKNMGFRNLELVIPGEVLSEEAKSMACDAGGLL
jgi:tRNA C32,U32 (ribose-2'-O)-methylase TrmJ